MSKSAKKSKINKETNEEDIVFGGALGVSFIMIWSHYILYYLWYCYQYNNARLIIPLTPNELISFIYDLCYKSLTQTVPSLYVIVTYTIYFVLQLILAAYVPGNIITGLGVKDGKRLKYLCNAYNCYYITLGLLGLLHVTGIYPITTIIDNIGEYLTISIIVGNITSLYWYIYGFIVKETERMSGNHIYDFFMGSLKFPRIGIVDIKMISEVRWSWLLLFLISLSCTVKEYQIHGQISKNLLFMCIAHWLYSNACVKGEHFIPYFWDMYYEKYGWMLNFWNIVGVPFMYCYSSLFILKNHDIIVNSVITGNPFYLVLCFTILLASYYYWDCLNGSKADFKAPELRALKIGYFPVFKNAQINDAKYIKTENGSKLLIDGYWKFGRKLHYTCDILMALSWGMITGFNDILPYWYCIFFTIFIVHRYKRDEIRCNNKYGKYWKKYKETVPYVFIPGIF